MKKIQLPLSVASLATCATLLGAALAPSAACAGEPPAGWFLAGSNPKDYETAVDREVVHAAKTSVSLKGIGSQPAGFGTLMQMCKAGTYRGKRVRLSGYLRSQDLKSWAGLWFRVDGPKGEPLAFDNMENRPIKGTSDWTKCEIVLDVPDQAKELAYGVLLAGAGQVWMAELKFDIVEKSVPLTGAKPDGIKSQPTNLNFEK
jgi:hypothetical protein